MPFYLTLLMSINCYIFSYTSHQRKVHHQTPHNSTDFQYQTKTNVAISGIHQLCMIQTSLDPFYINDLSNSKQGYQTRDST